MIRAQHASSSFPVTAMAPPNAIQLHGLTTTLPNCLLVRAHEDMNYFVVVGFADHHVCPIRSLISLQTDTVPSLHKVNQTSACVPTLCLHQGLDSDAWGHRTPVDTCSHQIQLTPLLPSTYTYAFPDISVLFSHL